MLLKSDSLLLSSLILKEASFVTVVPIPWSAPEQSAPLPPIMITEPLRFQPHQKPTSSAPCKSLPHEVCPKPSVVWYCPPYRTLHFPRHKPLDQTEPFLKSPLLVILERNVFPLRQFPVVPNRGVCPESSLRVILISLPPTSQNAGEIMSALYDGSAVSPAGWILSYHQSQESSIQFFASLFENRAMRVQAWSTDTMSQCTWKRIKNSMQSYISVVYKEGIFLIPNILTFCDTNLFFLNCPYVKNNNVVTKKFVDLFFSLGVPANIYRWSPSLVRWLWSLHKTGQASRERSLMRLWKRSNMMTSTFLILS